MTARKSSKTTTTKTPATKTDAKLPMLHGIVSEAVLTLKVDILGRGTKVFVDIPSGHLGDVISLV